MISVCPLTPHNFSTFFVGYDTDGVGKDSTYEAGHYSNPKPSPSRCSINLSTALYDSSISINTSILVGFLYLYLSFNDILRI
jgi:hypothetical protein